MGRIRILIADDHAVVRKGVRKLLENETDLQVIDEADNGRQVLEKVRVLHPEVLLLDIGMPGLNGLETAQLVKGVSAATRIVIFSIHEKVAYIRKALQAGALGYILKGGASEEIPAAIRAAHRGRYFLSAPINTSVIDSYLRPEGRESPDEAYQKLSERERQVFHLLVEGKSTLQIAQALYISPKTVEKHRVNIQNKLGLENPVAMVKYAVCAGLVDPDFWNF
jgi:two-component system, NarL family, response regulator NreC